MWASPGRRLGACPRISSTGCTAGLERFSFTSPEPLAIQLVRGSVADVPLRYENFRD